MKLLSSCPALCQALRLRLPPPRGRARAVRPRTQPRRPTAGANRSGYKAGSATNPSRGTAPADRTAYKGSGGRRQQGAYRQIAGRERGSPSREHTPRQSPPRHRGGVLRSLAGAHTVPSASLTSSAHADRGRGEGHTAHVIGVEMRGATTVTAVMTQKSEGTGVTIPAI